MTLKNWIYYMTIISGLFLTGNVIAQQPYQGKVGRTGHTT